MLLRESIIAAFDSNLPKRVLFRVDADSKPGLSFGHLIRCLILSEALQRNFAVKPAFFMRVGEKGRRVARSQGAILLQSEAEIEEFDPDAVVVDLPGGMDRPWPGRRVILIVDTDVSSPFHEDAEALWNSSVLAHPEMFPSKTRLLLGSEYFISSPELEKVVPKKRGDDEKPHLLVTLGGGDPTGLTPKIVSRLGQVLDWGMEITVHLGPGYFHERELEESLTALEGNVQLEGRVQIVRSPESMAPLLLKADMAICAGGRTLYELTRLGVPCLAIATAPHEADVIQAFNDQGIIAGGICRWNTQAFDDILEQIGCKYKK